MKVTDLRTPERIRAHYEIEKELSNRLRHATREERRTLYTVLYDELYRRVPDHPQLTIKADPETQAQIVAVQMRMLGRFLKPETTFLEIGPGDCSLSFEVARVVKKVFAVDVSAEITRHMNSPENFQLLISDGTSIPVPVNSVDVAYSNQLMEHLHPDDAFEQLRNLATALKSGGIYICITPNRLLGPHDVSKYFDEVATGFHLKEYTLGELSTACNANGFSKVASLVSYHGYALPVTLPLFPFIWLENLINQFPPAARKKIAILLAAPKIVAIK